MTCSSLITADGEVSQRAFGHEPLTISTIAKDPWLLTTCLTEHNVTNVMFRPLLHNDVCKLAEFLGDLSDETRRFSTYECYVEAAAQSMCDAIARYDKLRFIAVANDKIIALLEVSLAITDDDRIRFRRYGIELNGITDIRFGPCLADDYQSRGLRTQLLRRTKSVACL